jgi:hypothetical protein
MEQPLESSSGSRPIGLQLGRHRQVASSDPSVMATGSSAVLRHLMCHGHHELCFLESRSRKAIHKTKRASRASCGVLHCAAAVVIHLLVAGNPSQKYVGHLN